MSTVTENQSRALAIRIHQNDQSRILIVHIMATCHMHNRHRILTPTATVVIIPIIKSIPLTEIQTMTRMIMPTFIRHNHQRIPTQIRSSIPIQMMPNPIQMLAKVPILTSMFALVRMACAAQHRLKQNKRCGSKIRIQYQLYYVF